MEKNKRLGWLKTTLFIIGAIIAISLLEGYGVIGVILFLLILIGHRLFKNKESFATGMRNAETMIWGKPLDKDLWEKGELRHTKVKFVWGKGKFKLTKYHFYALAYGLLFVLIIMLWRLYR